MNADATYANGDAVDDTEDDVADELAAAVAAEHLGTSDIRRL